MPPSDRRVPADEHAPRSAKKLEQRAAKRRAHERAERLAVAELLAVAERLRRDVGCRERLAHRLAGMS